MRNVLTARKKHPVSTPRVEESGSPILQDEQEPEPATPIPTDVHQTDDTYTRQKDASQPLYLNHQELDAFHAFLQSYRPAQSPPPPPQPPQSSTKLIHQQIRQLNEKAKVWAPILSTVELAGTHTWSTWQHAFFRYTDALRLNTILDDDYEIPARETAEWNLWDVQDDLLRTFIITTVAASHRHLLNNARTAREQFDVLKKHLDLGSHAQAFNAAKGLSRLKFIIYQSSLAAWTSYVIQL